MIRRAQDGYEKVLGSEHPHTLTSVSNLLRDQRKYKDSERMNRHALEGSEKMPGWEHLASISNLALVVMSAKLHWRDC